VAQRFLAPKLSPDASKSQNSLLYSLIAGKSRGDGRDQHCVASHAVRRSENLPLILTERPANGGLLPISGQSPDSVIGSFGSKIVESLRPILGKFPFLGDCARRPSLICTAAPGLQSKAPHSPPWRRQVGNVEPGLPRRRGFENGGSRTWKWPEGGPHGDAIERENYGARQEEINSFFSRPLATSAFSL
jgi:hypothetical protein